MNKNNSSSSALMVLPSPIKEDEIEWKKGLPSGVKFRPSDKHIFHYLQMKVHTGHTDVSGVIRSINLYIYEPHDLKGLAFDNGDGRLYFFTPLKKKFTKGKKTKRLTGHGFWKVTQKTIYIMGDDNEPMMTKTPLCFFYPLEKGKSLKTQWLMDEYRLINEDNHPVMLENWALCVVHYKPIRGKNGNNVEQVEDGRSSTNKSSTGSMAEAVGSPSQNSMVGSSYESNPHISCGSNNFNVASSSYPQGTSSCPQPFQTLSNPNKRQQCSTSYDQPLYITCPSNDIASHAQFPKRRSPIANGTPNFDQNYQASHPSTFFNQMVSNTVYSTRICPDDYSCLEPLIT